ncbi:cache domain-containing sensor histidine kinase [Cohnella cellulosilytica]|uniref:histidine kinase n=1 Tax=Cohnella cellulosilytica TaxID=986710 RepID=A0ABW2FP24_9BACL
MSLSALRKLLLPFRRNIRNRLILIMVLLPVVPIAIVTAIAVENNRSSMEAEIVETNLTNMKWTADNLDERFAQLNNLIYSIQIYPELSDYMMNGTDDLSRRFAAQRSVMNMLTSVSYSSNRHLRGVQLYLKEAGRWFIVDSMRNDIETVHLPPEPFKELFDNGKDYVVRSSSNPERFQLVRSINRFENREKLGGIAIDVGWSVFHQSLELLASNDDERVMILNADGSVLYRPSGSRQADAELSAETVSAVRAYAEDGHGFLRTDEGYIFYGAIETAGLVAVKTVPETVITRSANRTMRTGLVVGLVSAVVSAIAASLLAWRMADPIVVLAKKMSRVGLMKETDRPPPNRIDEIGLLETRLYSMSVRIREHIKTEYGLKLEMKTAELKALQAQIHPHFLQNTLQLIGNMLFTKTPEECYGVIKSLSEMFRYVIREPNELVTVDQELGHLAHYLRIQEMRFAGRLSCRLETESPEALIGRLPKLTLQPLAENAFVHGFEAKPGPWLLHVSLRAENGRMAIAIRDSGAGMPEEKLKETRRRLEAALAGQPPGDRIGLTNVASRIHKHFGAEGELLIDSERNKGTVVILRLPLPEKG